MDPTRLLVCGGREYDRWAVIRATLDRLRNARKHDQLEDFIKEHDADPPGDLDKLDEALKRPVRETGKEAPKASSRDASDD